MSNRTDGTHETELFIDNDEPLYRQKEAMRTNLARKMCRGVFDPAKAAKLFRYLTAEANKRYKREFGQTLPIPERRQAEAWFVHEFQRDVTNWRDHGYQDLTAEQIAILRKCMTPKGG